MVSGSVVRVGRFFPSVCFPVDAAAVDSAAVDSAAVVSAAVLEAAVLDAVPVPVLDEPHPARRPAAIAAVSITDNAFLFIFVTSHL